MESKGRCEWRKGCRPREGCEWLMCGVAISAVAWSSTRTDPTAAHESLDKRNDDSVWCRESETGTPIPSCLEHRLDHTLRSRTPLVRPGAPRAGPVRRRPRRVDRQRRAAVDRQRPPVLPGRPLLGHQRLHAHLRRLPPARRPHGRPARPPPDVPRRPDPVRARLAGRRLRRVQRPADRRSRRAGPRRRAAVARRALAGDRDLRRGRGAQQGARRLGRRGRLRRRRRRAGRRHAHRVGRLGVGPVRQRADRPRSRPRSPRDCCPRAATPARATSTSRAP